MALIKCPECRKKVSDQCGKCPNCGYPIEAPKTPIETPNNNCVDNKAANDKKTAKQIKERKPINKKLLIGIISVVVILLTVGGILGYKALLPRINATKDFDTAVKFVEQKNKELETEISQSEDLIAKKQPLLDETLVSTLENAISDAKAVKITNFKVPKKAEDIISRTKELNKTDYSDAIANLNEKHTALEINAKRYQLVNVPTEAYVIQCLKTIPEITGISAVTEDNDPNGNLNKAGGYTATVYFSHQSINQDDIYGDTLIEKGTDAGGGIEVYTCVEDAVKRRDYLATFDGSVLASGTHTVIGTVLVRTSNELTASKQKELEAKLIAALTYIEKNDGKIETPVNPKPEETRTEEIKSEEIPSTTQTPTVTQTNPVVAVDRNQEATNKALELANNRFPMSRGSLKTALLEISYSEPEAEYAINNANINWNEHALAKVKAYLSEHSLNSNNFNDSPNNLAYYSNLHDSSLGWNGFTDSEKRHAVQNCGINWGIVACSQVSTVANNTPQQAVSELVKIGFSKSDAEYGVQNANFDWGSQAANYILNNFDSSYTKSAVVAGLKNVGFTDAAIEKGLLSYADEFFAPESGT